MADLFAELHRRHPDVDLVILPPEPPLVDVDEVTDDEITASLSRVTEAVERLWSAVAPDSEVEPHARWSYAADPGRVRALARVVDHRGDGLHVLVGLRHELERHGWAVTRPPGAVERLRGFLDELELTASYAEQPGATPTLVVTVTSRPLPVGTVRATTLVRGGR